jgi:hypothetical protein
VLAFWSNLLILVATDWDWCLLLVKLVDSGGH